MCLHRQFRVLAVQKQIRKSARRVATCGSGCSGWRRRDPSSQMADGLRTRGRLLLAPRAFINKLPCADGSRQLTRLYGSSVSHSFARQLAGLALLNRRSPDRSLSRTSRCVHPSPPAGRDRLWARAADERHLDAIEGDMGASLHEPDMFETPVGRSRRESSVRRPSDRCRGIAAQGSPVAPDLRRFEQDLVH